MAIAVSLGCGLRVTQSNVVRCRVSGPSSPFLTPPPVVVSLVSAANQSGRTAIGVIPFVDAVVQRNACFIADEAMTPGQRFVGLHLTANAVIDAQKRAVV